jgi:hypothetical protein
MRVNESQMIQPIGSFLNFFGENFSAVLHSSMEENFFSASVIR